MKTFLLLIVTIAAALASENLPKLRYPPSPRITRGNDAAPGQFPHQVTYEWGFFGILEHICGGSILSETWVLTAAHCVVQLPEIGEHIIIAGIINLLEETPNRQQVSVVGKIVHPDYSGDVGPNDIALLQLATPLVFGDFVQPINLPEAGCDPTGDAVLSGWGSISQTEIPVMPYTLQTITMPILTFDDCNNAINAIIASGEVNPLAEESNICTGPLVGAIGTCTGDSGSPLIQDTTIVGVVTWGFTPCGFNGAPSIYTKVCNFLDFINEHVTDIPK